MKPFHYSRDIKVYISLDSTNRNKNRDGKPTTNHFTVFLFLKKCFLVCSWKVQKILTITLGTKEGEKGLLGQFMN